MVPGNFGRTLPMDGAAGDIIGNLFPEGIQLGSIEISRVIFRIPEGMRPFSKFSYQIAIKSTPKKRK
jgi:hypothetical protein